jgi:hypothetical protein
MQLTFTAWVESPTLGKNMWQIVSKTQVCMSARPSFHWSPFVMRFVFNTPKVKFMHTSKEIVKWRIQNKELYTLYSSPSITRVIKQRRLRLVGHVDCMRKRCIQGFGGET